MRGRLLLLVALAAGCDDDSTKPDEGTLPPDFQMSLDLWQPTDLSVGDLTQPDLATSACTPPPFYPRPPYGYRVGRVIADLMFQGKHDDNGNGYIDSGDTVTTISLHDYFQNSTNQLLVIVSSAVWCTPCNQEQAGLNTLWKTYHPRVSFLTALADGANPGTPATIKNLNNWGAFYKVPYEMAIDPTRELLLYNPGNAFPMQMLVRTSDMQIVWIDNGADSSTLQAAIDGALAALPDGGASSTQACDLGGMSGAVDGGALDYCDTCTSDGQCPADAVCATDIHGEHFCGKRCGVDLDCPQNYAGYPPFETCVADPGGKGNVCRPVAGACHGAGNVCDWCRPSVASDCASGLKCVVLTTGERLCTESCTVTASTDNTTGAISYSNDSCPSGSYCDVGPPQCSAPPPGCSEFGGCGGDPSRAQVTCHFAPQD